MPSTWPSVVRTCPPTCRAESTCPIADLVGISGALLDDGGIPPPPDIIPDCLNAPLPLLRDSGPVVPGHVSG